MQPSNTVGCAFFLSSQSSEKPQTACIARVRPLATTFWQLRGTSCTNEDFFACPRALPAPKKPPPVSLFCSRGFFLPLGNRCLSRIQLRGKSGPQSMETNSFLSCWQLFLSFLTLLPALANLEAKALRNGVYQPEASFPTLHELQKFFNDTKSRE